MIGAAWPNATGVTERHSPVTRSVVAFSLAVFVLDLFAANLYEENCAGATFCPFSAPRGYHVVNAKLPRGFHALST